MRNRYENVFILTPVLSEKQTKEATKKVKDFIKKHEGEVRHEEHWGLRKLAYPIQKKTTGFYHLVEFEAEGDVIAKLERVMKQDERILRFLTVKMDKDAIEWAEKRKEKRSKGKDKGNQSDQKQSQKKEEVSSK